MSKHRYPKVLLTNQIKHVDLGHRSALEASGSCSVSVQGPQTRFDTHTIQIDKKFGLPAGWYYYCQSCALEHYIGSTVGCTLHDRRKSFNTQAYNKYATFVEDGLQSKL